MAEQQGPVQHFAYQFEAKGIQRYILHSGKLRDIVGASDLVAGLASSTETEDDIGRLIQRLSLDNEVQFSRRAGGAFCLHGPHDSLVRIRQHWRFYILTQLPGLEFLDVISRAESGNSLDAMRACFKEAGGIRSNMLAEVPGMGRPISLIGPLTGRPAVDKKDYGPETVWIDRVTQPQRARANPVKLDRVASRFVDDPETWKFPRDYDAPDDEYAAHDNPIFPFKGSDARIALVHADLSGLGELFRILGAKFSTPQANYNLAKDIEDRIMAAAKAAMQSAILPHAVGVVVPARPVLLGGDDITIIVRADLAIVFTKALLEQIEDKCKDIGANSGCKALSACAGIAIVNKGLPFLTTSHLAEDLCSFAKKEVKAKEISIDNRAGYASALAFHLYTETAQDSYDEIRDRMRAGFADSTANPYRLGQRAGVTSDLDCLLDIQTKLAAVEGGAGTVRSLRTAWHQGEAKAREIWDRWWQVGLADQADAMKALAVSMGYLHDGKPAFEELNWGILFDAHRLIDISGVAQGTTAPEQAVAEPA
jgi:hypothetical protein